MGENNALYNRNHVHVRPTEIDVQVRDLSPPPINTVMPQTVTHDSSSNLPMEEPVYNTKDELDDAVLNQENNAEHSNTVCQRPKRNVKTPTYLKDYVRL